MIKRYKQNEMNTKKKTERKMKISTKNKQKTRIFEKDSRFMITEFEFYELGMTCWQTPYAKTLL